MRVVGGLWIVVLAATCVPAAAAQLSDLVPARDGAAACWSRLYDAAHLNAHPDQQVREMGFSITHSAATSEFSAQYDFRIEAKMRNGDVGYNTGPCSEENGKIWCGVECDGGYVMVEPRANGGVVLDLEASGYIRLSGGCGVDGDEESGFDLKSGEDDKEFLLRPMAKDMCGPTLLD